MAFHTKAGVSRTSGRSAGRLEIDAAMQRSTPTDWSARPPRSRGCEAPKRLCRPVGRASQRLRCGLGRSPPRAAIPSANAIAVAAMPNDMTGESPTQVPTVGRKLPERTACSPSVQIGLEPCQGSQSPSTRPLMVSVTQASDGIGVVIVGIAICTIEIASSTATTVCHRAGTKAIGTHSSITIGIRCRGANE